MDEVGSTIKCLCLGPKCSGKTHLLRALHNPDAIDETTYSVPTIGTNVYNIKFPIKTTNSNSNPVKVNSKEATSDENSHKTRSQKVRKSIRILEIGGTMAPIWRKYYNDVQKLIYVVDTSNLCQISAAGVLLYSMLTEPRLQKTEFLLVLSKMDYAYRQMRNEALLMLQMSKLEKQIRQNVTIIEASPVTKVGLDKIYDWLQKP